MKRGKKAQFYIIAAAIIISVLIGVYVLRNYVKVKPEYTKIYDLSEELGLETGYVHDYGIYNANNTDILIEDWASIYDNYTKGQGVVDEWVLMYGNEDNMTILYFTQESVGGICIDHQACIETTKTLKGKGNIRAEGKKIKVQFKDFDYYFDLNEGENFFFVIRGGQYSTQG